jgi:hypothetical protein
MSTSGTSVWSLKRDAVINSALRKLVVLSGGSPPAAYETTNAAEALNAMIKGFQVDGMPVWAIKDYSLTTVAGQSSYNIGVGQTTNTPMPLKLIQCARVESTGAMNVPMEIKTHYDFNLLPVNATAGEPVNVFYQPFSTFGTLQLWPTPSDSNTVIQLTYQRPFEDMNSSTDDFDFPSYWEEALIYGLAWRMSYEYGVPILDRQELQKAAEMFHDKALSFGTEEGSLFFMPSTDWRK